MTRIDKIVMRIAMVLLGVLAVIQLNASYISAQIGGRMVPGTDTYSIGVIGIPCDMPIVFAGLPVYCHCDVAPMYGAMLLAFAYFAYKASRDEQQKFYFDLVMIYTIGQIVLIAHDYTQGHWTWWVMLLLLCYGILTLAMVLVRKHVKQSPGDLQ